MGKIYSCFIKCNVVICSLPDTVLFCTYVFQDLADLDDDLEVAIPSKSPSKIEVETTEPKIDSIRKDQKVGENIFERKVESNLMNKNIAGSPVSEQPVASLSKTASSSGGLLLSNDRGKAVPNSSVDNNSGFVFSSVPPGTRPATSVSATPLASVNDDKKTGASISIFGLKQPITSDLETSTVKNKSTLGQRYFSWLLVSLLTFLWTIYAISSNYLYNKCITVSHFHWFNENMMGTHLSSNLNINICSILM